MSQVILSDKHMFNVLGVSVCMIEDLVLVRIEVSRFTGAAEMVVSLIDYIVVMCARLISRDFRLDSSDWRV